MNETVGSPIGRTERLPIAIPAIVGFAGIVASVIGSLMNKPIVNAVSFGNAGEWFSGSASMAAVYVALKMATSARGEQRTRAIQSAISLSYSYRTLVENFSASSSAYGPMVSEIAGVYGRLSGAVLEISAKEPWLEDLAALKPLFTNGQWTKESQEQLLIRIDLLRTRLGVVS